MPATKKRATKKGTGAKGVKTPKERIVELRLAISLLKGETKTKARDWVKRVLGPGVKVEFI